MIRRNLSVTTLNTSGANICNGNILGLKPYLLSIVCSVQFPEAGVVHPSFLLKMQDKEPRILSQAKGLSIIATINQRTYETNRPIEPSYEEEKSKRIIFDDSLPKWNYVIKLALAYDYLGSYFLTITKGGIAVIVRFAWGSPIAFQSGSNRALVKTDIVRSRCIVQYRLTFCTRFSSPLLQSPHLRLSCTGTLVFAL